MRLYVKDKKTKQNIFIDDIANTRKEISQKIGSTKIRINNQDYYVSDINAMPDDSIGITTGLGGVIGLLGGIPGLIAGGIIGGLLARNSDLTDKAKAIYFNKSKVWIRNYY